MGLPSVFFSRLNFEFSSFGPFVFGLWGAAHPLIAEKTKNIDAKKKSNPRFARKIEEDDNFLRSQDRKKIFLQKVGIFCCCLRK